jgi:hypothetical protein
MSSDETEPPDSPSLLSDSPPQLAHNRREEGCRLGGLRKPFPAPVHAPMIAVVAPIAASPKQAVAEQRSQSQPPPAGSGGEWREARDKADGRAYYWNTVTREVSWSRPDGVRVRAASQSQSQSQWQLSQAQSQLEPEHQSLTAVQRRKNRGASRTWSQSQQLAEEEEETDGVGDDEVDDDEEEATQVVARHLLHQPSSSQLPKRLCSWRTSIDAGSSSANHTQNQAQSEEEYSALMLTQQQVVSVDPVHTSVSSATTEAAPAAAGTVATMATARPATDTPTLPMPSTRRLTSNRVMVDAAERGGGGERWQRSAGLHSQKPLTATAISSSSNASTPPSFNRSHSTLIGRAAATVVTTSIVPSDAGATDGSRPSTSGSASAPAPASTLTSASMAAAVAKTPLADGKASAVRVLLERGQLKPGVSRHMPTSFLQLPILLVARIRHRLQQPLVLAVVFPPFSTVQAPHL